MPNVTVTQNPAIVYDEIITFPVPRYEDVLPLINPGFPQGRFLASNGIAYRQDSLVHQYVAQTNNALAAGFSYLTDAAGGPPYFQCGSAGAGRQVVGLDGMAAKIDTGAGRGLAAGCQRASSERYWWLKWWMSSDIAPAFDVRNGLLLVPGNSSGAFGWIDDAVLNQGGFGFTMTAAGQWQYSSWSSAAALTLRENIALPAHTLTDWNQFEICITNAAPGSPASVEILFNGALIATRNWTGALLENYAANDWRFLPLMCGGNTAAAAGDCRFAGVELKRGRFTRLGLELTA